MSKHGRIQWKQSRARVSSRLFLRGKAEGALNIDLRERKKRSLGAIGHQLLLGVERALMASIKRIYRLSPPALISLAAEGIFSNAGGELILNFRIDNLPGWRSSLLGSRGGGNREVPWSYLPALPIMGRAFVLSLRLLTP